MTPERWKRLADRFELALEREPAARAELRWPERWPVFGTHPALVALANNLPFRDGPARTAAARGNLRAAIEIYRRLNQPGITAKWTSVHEPRLVLAVARLADRAGDRETARAEYTRFLELWKGADTGLPELAESQKYLKSPGS